MQKIKCLKVLFDTQIAPYEIPAFRGGIIEKVGKQETVLFHQHQNDKLRYAYPLIQYKRIGSQPMIMCLGEGVGEIHKFFSKQNWNIHLSGRELDMAIDRLDMHQFTMQVWEKTFSYQISNWIALNQKSYKEYNELESLADQTKLLESKLVGNIISFAKGIGWTIDKEVVCQITEMQKTNWVKVKGVKMLGFNLKFKTNVFLPNHIGLGSKVSFGFGCVREVGNSRNSKKA